MMGNEEAEPNRLVSLLDGIEAVWGLFSLQNPEHKTHEHVNAVRFQPIRDQREKEQYKPSRLWRQVHSDALFLIGSFS